MRSSSLSRENPSVVVYGKARVNLIAAGEMGKKIGIGKQVSSQKN